MAPTYHNDEGMSPFEIHSVPPPLKGAATTVNRTSEAVHLRTRRNAIAPAILQLQLHDMTSLRSWCASPVPFPLDSPFSTDQEHDYHEDDMGTNVGSTYDVETEKWVLSRILAERQHFQDAINLAKTEYLRQKNPTTPGYDNIYSLKQLEGHDLNEYANRALNVHAYAKQDLELDSLHSLTISVTPASRPRTTPSNKTPGRVGRRSRVMSPTTKHMPPPLSSPTCLPFHNSFSPLSPTYNRWMNVPDTTDSDHGDQSDAEVEFEIAPPPIIERVSGVSPRGRKNSVCVADLQTAEPASACT